MKYYIKKLAFNTIFFCSSVLVRSTLNSPLTIFYTWVNRGTMRVKCLAQEHNAVNIAVPQPGVKSGVKCTIKHASPLLRFSSQIPKFLCDANVTTGYESADAHYRYCVTFAYWQRTKKFSFCEKSIAWRNISGAYTGVLSILHSRLHLAFSDRSRPSTRKR